MSVRVAAANLVPKRIRSVLHDDGTIRVATLPGVNRLRLETSVTRRR